jgi:serine protease
VSTPREFNAARSAPRSVLLKRLAVSTLALNLLAAACLSACGGGGGEGTSGNPNPGGGGGGSGTQVSGEIKVAENTQVDSDVNDPFAPYTANDRPESAQPLANPSSLGGYVNAAGKGQTGRSFAAGDLNDVFVVDAIQGQTVTLVVGQPTQGDVDLYLYNATTGTVVAESKGVGRLETVSIPATGKYYVIAHIDSGASNYVLTIGQPRAASAGAEEADTDPASALSTEAEFMPGEVIVRWNSPEQAQAKAESQALSAGLNAKSVAKPGSAASTLGTYGVSTLAASPAGVNLLKLDNPGAQPASSASVQALVAPAQAGAKALGADTAPSELDAKIATLDTVKRLRADPNVAYAEPNYIRRAEYVPTDELYSSQWHYPLINLPTAWDITRGSNSVIVAVVDTGVLLRHPDLAGQLVPGFDFVSNLAGSLDGDGIDNDPNDPGDHGRPNGSSGFHGTHVAGTVAAASGGNTRGVTGVAPLTRIMPVRVLGRRGTGSAFDILQGILFSAGLPNASGTVPAQRADIINLSLGGAPRSQAEQEAINQVRAQGVIVVGAAGNDNSSTLMYPASYDGVISVSASTINRTLSSFSNFGSKIAVSAPGGDFNDANGDGRPDQIWSTVGDDSTGSIVYTYGPMVGTSQASPHMAGVLALMKAVRPTLTPTQVDTLLAAGRLTIDIGAPGRDDRFGHGLIDASKAVQAAQGTSNLPGILVATPNVINLSPATSTIKINLGNGGDQALQVSAVQVTPASPWLSVAAPAGASGLGEYTLTVNRANLTPGAYRANVNFVAGAVSTSVSVVMQVTAAGTTANSDLGHHYVLLVNPETMKAVKQVEVNVRNGVYAYQFSDVDAGNYMLVAGSDADNNGSICDIGEACGVYGGLQNPTVLPVTGSVTGRDFFSGFLTSISAASASADKVAADPLPLAFKRLQ